MAEIRSISIEPSGIFLNLKISGDEYSRLKGPRSDVVILPSDRDSFTESLTTGKLGNGNRIMLPNKVMAKNGVERLHKKVPSTILDASGGKYLLIKLEDNRPGVPSFEDD